MVRTLVLTSGAIPSNVSDISGQETDSGILSGYERTVLSENIIDIWATYSTPETNVSEIPTDTNSQQSQDQLSQYLTNFKKRLGQV